MIDEGRRGHPYGWDVARVLIYEQDALSLYKGLSVFIFVQERAISSLSTLTYLFKEYCNYFSHVLYVVRDIIFQ